jgi:pimeloyl-ACP methyl ester carboxylesterase
MSFAEINQINLYYEIQGFGEYVMFLHHGFGCTKIWSNIIPLFAKSNFTAIAYDRRGFGRSEEGSGFMDFYVSDAVRPYSVDELESLRNHLGVDSFHLVGQCEGGVLAFDYAAKYPERVKTVSISSTLCYSTVTMEEFNAAKFVKAFQELNPAMQEKLVFWHGSKAQPFFEQFRSFGGEYGKGFFDLRPVLRTVGHPSLILYPDRSFLFEVEQGVAFYRELPNADLAVMPNCGHNTYDENPEMYAALIMQFINRNKFKLDNMAGVDTKAVTCAG